MRRTFALHLRWHENVCIRIRRLLSLRACILFTTAFRTRSRLCWALVLAYFLRKGSFNKAQLGLAFRIKLATKRRCHDVREKAFRMDRGRKFMSEPSSEADLDASLAFDALQPAHLALPPVILEGDNVD